MATPVAIDRHRFNTCVQINAVLRSHIDSGLESDPVCLTALEEASSIAPCYRTHTTATHITYRPPAQALRFFLFCVLSSSAHGRLELKMVWG